MKKFLVGIWLWLAASVPAFANVPCSLPFNLTNGTIADASQVMANYNALVTCLTLAASAGVNSDITQLLGLSTPFSPALGGSTVYASNGAVTGTNTIVVNSVVPSNYTLTTNYTVIFVASGTNTGATTLQVGATAQANLFRNGAALVGGEIVAGHLVGATYDGTQYELWTNDGLASLLLPDQLLRGGANVTSFNGGSQSGGGTYTVDCGTRPLQFITNAGAFTIAAPALDGSCDILVTNGGTAGAISFSGFTVGSSTGDALTTTNTNKFIVSVLRINGTATYFVKALQ